MIGLTTALQNNSGESQRPLLGVIACNRMVAGEVAASVMQRYLLAAAEHMNASLVIIPSLPDFIEAPRLASMIDGCLLTGSPSNIASRFYGAPDAGAEGPFDERRDEVVRRLFLEMVEAGKPVLGICRGLQEVNVALGGTLRRDLATGSATLSHHAPADADMNSMFGHRHEIRLTEGGLLARALGASSIVVNSVHYQAIDRLAPGLSVEATAPDGVVEAVSARVGSSSVLAVQWHPEWQVHSNPESQALLRLYGNVLRGEVMPAQGGTLISQERSDV